MGEFVSRRWLTLVAWIVAITIMGLNGWLLVGTFRSWFAG
jgi:Mn2+/Fe2+ NRAMP family transporter